MIYDLILIEINLRNNLLKLIFSMFNQIYLTAREIIIPRIIYSCEFINKEWAEE